MTNSTSRHTIAINAVRNGEPVDLGFQITLPADLNIPLVGDEVKLPDEVASRAGFKNGIFTVISRRFLYSITPHGAEGLISLKVSQDS